MKFCPQCGARLPANARFCVECGAEIPTETLGSPPGHVSGGQVSIGDVGVLRGNIDASTHVSTHIDSQTNIGGDLNIHMGSREPSAEDIFDQSISALQVKNYPLAVHLFEQYTAKNPTDADGFYYLALASFQGNRPKFAQLTTIRTVENALRTATQIDPNCSHAFLLWALIKEDFYVANAMKVPPPAIAELTSRIHSVSKIHAAEIITHVPCPRNKIWEWLRRSY